MSQTKDTIVSMSNIERMFSCELFEEKTCKIGSWRQLKFCSALFSFLYFLINDFQEIAISSLLQDEISANGINCIHNVIDIPWLPLQAVMTEKIHLTVCLEIRLHISLKEVHDPDHYVLSTLAALIVG